MYRFLSFLLLVELSLLEFHPGPRLGSAEAGERRAVGRSQRKGGVVNLAREARRKFLQVNYIHYGRGLLIRLIRLLRDLRNAKNGTSGIETSSKT